MVYYAGLDDSVVATAEKVPAGDVFNANYENQAKIINDTSLKGLEDKNNTNPKVLDQFDDTTFGVGNTDVFKVLSDEFEGTIDNILSQIDDYVAIAQAALEAIKAAIAQDQAARAEAQKAYDEVMSNDAAYTYADTENGVPYLHEAEQQADAQAAYNEVWYAKCWKPGQ